MASWSVLVPGGKSASQGCRVKPLKAKKKKNQIDQKAALRVNWGPRGSLIRSIIVINDRQRMWVGGGV